MKKIIRITALVLLCLVILLLAAPFLLKKQIVQAIQRQINQQLNATVYFDPNIGISFFRHFPNIDLRIDSLAIVNHAPFAGDTLLCIDRLHVVVDLSSLWGEKAYQIKRVELNRPYIKLLVNQSGQANWDITRPATTPQQQGTPSSFHAALQSYVVQNGNIVYADTSLHFFLHLQGLDHTGSGDFTQEIFTLKTHSVIQSLYLAYGGIPYLNGVKTNVDVNLQVDVPHQRYSFDQGHAQFNGLNLIADGFVALPDTQNVEMDIRFHTQQSDFKNLLSLIPAIYQKNFDQLKASGKAIVEGRIYGLYNDKRIPNFNFQLLVQNGMFKYPSLPEPLQQVNVQLLVRNDDGIVDHTVIDLKQLHLMLDRQPFDAHVTIQYPQSDPLIDGAVKGNINLSSLSKIYPFEKGTQLGGNIQADVQVKGRLSALTKKQYHLFQASGQINAQHVNYRSASFPQGIEIANGSMQFSPQRVDLSQLMATIGKNDIQAKGRLDEFYGYVFGKSPLKATLDFRSHYLNLNTLMADSSAHVTDTAGQVKAIILPKNINVDLHTQIDRFIYGRYDLSNLTGDVHLANGVLSINPIKANLLGGSALISGKYDTRNAQQPLVDFHFQAQQFDIGQALNTFLAAKAFAPLAAFVQGSFSGDFNLNTLLTDQLMPILPTVNSLGKLQIFGLQVNNFPPLQQLASTLDVPQLKQIQLPKLGLSFQVDSGYLEVKPFSLQVDSIQMLISGKNALNQTIDYTIRMQIPRRMLGKANTQLNQLLTQASAATGSSIDVGESVELLAQLTGSIKNPHIALDFSPTTSRVKQSLTQAAAQQLQAEKNKLVQQLLKSGEDSMKQSTSDTTPIRQQIENKLKNTLKKGLNRFLKTKSDTGS
ncbi:MAG: DUF3971 domain-containing protein [Thermoflavifilum sp.]|nr:DUF3971 domain-containing protein [Thermoflavifilum sp.]